MTKASDVKSVSAYSVADILSAKGWMPEAGDEITGKVVFLEMSDNSNSEYPAYPIITIERDENGDLVKVHAFHSILRDGLKKVRPSVGSLITVKYAGKVASKNKDAKGESREYHSYVVFDPTAEVVSAEINWDDVPF